MPYTLVIVESPAKARTIEKYLGRTYKVEASQGHIRDLPKSLLGVDTENNFEPHYITIRGRGEILEKIRKEAKGAKRVLLATDPDREGEAISWHLAQALKIPETDVCRVEFNEITEKTVKAAVKKPRTIDMDLVSAQQARRVLDRLVGYKISPLLWKTVKRGISAGRVQSVALRLIVEREEARQAFKSEEYWLFKALLAGEVPPVFKASLARVNGKKAKIGCAEEAEALENAMKGQPFVVKSVERKARSRAPMPPFITSTLQQTANQRFGYTAKHTMSIAQRLYEGVELRDHGTTALITYMRTDSVRIADEARDAAAALIRERWGETYLPKKPRVYKTKGNAQDAHEAIRPVDVNLTPEMVREDLDPSQYALYSLIWSRFTASQMADAKFDDTVVMTECGPTEWKSKGEVQLFDGWLAAMPRSGKAAENADDDDATDLPPLTQGQVLQPKKIDKEQKFTQPPARFNEATLVKELEELGIGRPSTYASIISTLRDREYVESRDKQFVPTDLGKVVCCQLRDHFTRLMDVGFTAHMEEELDQVAEGKRNWTNLMKDFADDFYPTLDDAGKNMQSIKSGVETDIACPECGKKMVIKFGKAGSFLACTGFPECRHTCNFTRDESGNLQPEEKKAPQYTSVGTCPECGSDLAVKQTRAGSRFIACTAYPKCNYARPFSTGIACPKEGCSGTLVEKMTKRGKIFYACDQYPQCDFATWDKPVPGPCPQCGYPFLAEKRLRGGARKIMCPEKCGYTADVQGDTAEQ